MRWFELNEDDVGKPRTKKRVPAKTVRRARVIPDRYADVPHASGPIVGIPAEEIEAWVDSWDSEDEKPAPKSRRIA